MQLLYVSTFMFHKENDEEYGLPSCADSFFGKYLDIFDSVKVLGVEVRGYLDKSKLVRIQDKRIKVDILPENTRPQDFRNDKVLKAALTKEISEAEAILIKPASRRGMMAIKIAKKLKKPYMIEMTGDIHNALTQSPSRIKRLYAPMFYRQIKRAISDCKYALYVSRDYLQGKYPIAKDGVGCGCSDVVLELGDATVLNKRLEKIEAMQPGLQIKMALVGFYHGNGKGVDTALRAMARLPENYTLAVLGNGTQESRESWYQYAKDRGVGESRLTFPEPLGSVSEVLRWLDEYDVFVFPTRSEGFGRCVAEAMSRGLLCFATDICTMPELLPQECLFPLDDDQMLAELLLKYTSDRNLMKMVAKMNYEHSKDYAPQILRQRRNAFLCEFKKYCEGMKGQG